MQAVLSSFGSQQSGPARPAHERMFRARSKWWKDPGKNSTANSISLHFFTDGSVSLEVGEPFPPQQSWGVLTFPEFSYCISAPWPSMWRVSPSHCWKHVLTERTPGVLPANCSQTASHFVGLLSAWLGCSLCLAEVVPYGANASTSVCVSAWPCNPRALCKRCSALIIFMSWGQSQQGLFSTLPQFIFSPQICQSIRSHHQRPGTR